MSDLQPTDDDPRFIRTFPDRCTAEVQPDIDTSYKCPLCGNTHGKRKAKDFYRG